MRRALARTCAGTLLIGAALATAGCESGKVEGKLDAGVQALFSPRKTPQQYMLVAVSSEDPDVRRDAVARINKSPNYNAEWAIKGYVALACLENDAQTRCIAIRALGRTGDPRATETMLKVLNYQTYPPQEVWPPNTIVRWDATLVLGDLSAAGKVPEEQREAVRKTLLERLRLDTDRNVRVAAARGLGCYPSDETLKGLIEALRDEHYAVVHECENSLVKLTGVTHNGSLAEWEAWYNEHQQAPFAQAGQVPESRRPPYSNAWEKSWYDTRETVRWLWPGSKD